MTWNGAAEDNETTLDMVGEIRIFDPLRLVLQVSKVFGIAGVETKIPGSMKTGAAGVLSLGAAF